MYIDCSGGCCGLVSMMRLQARQIHPLQKQQQAGDGAFGRKE
jgi:hypothetical protein